MVPLKEEQSIVGSDRPCVLAIDLGGSGTRVALVDDRGTLLATEYEPSGLILYPDGGAEQDAEDWWNKTLSATRRVIRQSGVSPGQIVGIGCDSQWSVVVPVDENARPLMNAIHWFDTRGAVYNQKVSHGFPKIAGYGLGKLIRWLHYTGLAPTSSGADSLAHVLFIKNRLPEIYRKTFCFLEPMDYLTARLTGKITASQKTMGPFLVMDNRRWGTLEYNDRLLSMAGLEKKKFPELIPNDGIVGTILPSLARELGLDPSTKIISGLADSNASLIGCGALNYYEPIIYIGTSLYMSCHVPGKKTDLASFMVSTPGALPGSYWLFGEQGIGGKSIEFILRNIVYAEDGFETGKMPDDMYTRFNEMAAKSPPGSRGLVFLPWLTGTLVPDENALVRGGFINLSLKTDRSDMARSVFEALAYNNRWTLSAMKRFTGKPVDHFRFSGGGALSDLFSQIHADVLGVPVHQMENPTHSTLLGTALLTFSILGNISYKDIPGLVKTRKVFEPDPKKRNIYDRIFKQYRELFRRNRPVFEALNS